jgi:hypothetical protein
MTETDTTQAKVTVMRASVQLKAMPELPHDLAPPAAHAAAANG